MSRVMIDRKINAMHKRFGVCWGKTCKECDHLISGEWHDRRYHKCELYGMSHSEATDWRVSWMACGKFNMEVVPKPTILDEIRHAPKPQEPPLDGQMDISAFLSEGG